MEMVHLMQDGLTNLEAWYGATGLAAPEVGQPDTGTLVPGQRADLLICSDDVIEDPGRFEGSLLEVIKDGEGFRGALEAFPQRSYRSAVESAIGPAGEA